MFKKILTHALIGCGVGMLSAVLTFKHIFNLEAIAAFFWWFYIVCAILVILFNEYVTPPLTSLRNDNRINYLQKKMLRVKELYDAETLSKEEYDEQINGLKKQIKVLST